MIHVTIKGLQQAQQAMLKLVTAVKPQGGLGRAVLYAATEAHRELVANTHVDTGAYRASQYITRESEARYRLHIADGTRNPRTGARPAVYGVVEEARGGTHAAYRRTWQQGQSILGRAAMYLVRELS